MAEEGSRTPASSWSAYAENVPRIFGEYDSRDKNRPSARSMMDTTDRLRKSLRDADIQGFRRGGRVHRTGIYRLHRGERVIPARAKRRGRR